jgi:polyisoprenoid-binding protein YceI
MRRTAWFAVPLVLAASPAAGQQPPAAAPAGPNAWNVDRSHSQVGFVVRHFFTPVRGKFDSVQVSLQFDPDNPAASAVEVTIVASSVNTGHTRRDNDLRSANFFEVARYPLITFKSSAVRATGPNAYVATGTLTIRDVSRDIELLIQFLGRQEMPTRDGGTREVAGFEAGLTIDRRDFGVGTGDWVRTNVVGGDVKIEIAIEASRRLGG